MPAPLLAALIIAVAVYVALAPLRGALAALLAVSFLIPSALLFPGSPNGYPSFHRIALAAFAFNLVRRARRGEFPSQALSATPVHIALAAYVVITFVTGAVLGARDVPPIVSLFLWVFIVDEAVFFVTVVTAIRAIRDLRWVASLAAVIVTVTGFIAIWEHFTGSSYGAWFFRDLPAQAAAAGSGSLEIRGAEVRVRAAADFALAYGWIATVMLPVVFVVAAHARRRIAFVAPAALLLSILWSYTRSIYLGLGIIALLLLVLTAKSDRRVSIPLALSALGLVVVVAALGTLGRSFQAPDVQASTEGRAVRLPILLREASERPFLGTGFAFLSHELDIAGTDASFLLTYVELGVIGIASFALLMVVVVSSVGHAWRASAAYTRSLAAAALAGVVAGLAAGAFFDAFPPFRPFWLVAAIGIAAGEGGRMLPPTGIRWVRAPVVALVGAGLGALVLLAAPARAAGVLRFQTVNATTEAAAPGPHGHLRVTYVNTACDIMKTTAWGVRDARVDCYRLLAETGRVETGVGEVRIEAPSVEDVRDHGRAIIGNAARSVRGFQSHIISSHPRIRPTWVRTAPVWLAAVGFAAAHLSGAALRRRRKPRPAKRGTAQPPVGAPTSSA